MGIEIITFGDIEVENINFTNTKDSIDDVNTNKIMVKVFFGIKYFKGCVCYILLVCFISLKESTREVRTNVFYFTLKALFVVEIIKF